MNQKPLRLLLAEDNAADAMLVAAALERQGFVTRMTQVTCADEFRAALASDRFEIILCDYMIPGFGAIEALEILREIGVDLPLIIVSGTIGESVAVEAMRKGAADYILKDNLIRLGVAVEREIREAKSRRQKRQLDSFSHGQNEVLEMILNRVPLAGILERIIEKVEILSPGGVLCSIMLANTENTHLVYGAGASLPREYFEAIGPVPIHEGAGSCGTAAALGKTVIAEDLSTHPHWSSVREITARFKLHSCWSVPVFSSDRRVLGTLSVYHHAPQAPSREEIHWIESATKLVSLAIEQGRAAENLRESETLFRIASEAARLGGWTVDIPENRITWSEQVCAIHEMPAGTVPSLLEAFEFYPPEWRDTITRVFEECCKDGTPFDEELEIITAAGRRVWVRTVGIAIRDGNGEITRLQGAFQDISARKQAEHAEEANRSNELRYLEQRNALIALNASSPASNPDLTGTLRQITETAARTLDVVRVSIWRHGEGGNFIECLDQYDLLTCEHTSGMTIDLTEDSPYFSNLARMELIAADDARNDPLTREFSEKYLTPNGISSTLDVPIRLGSGPGHFLCNEHIGPKRRWTSDEKTFAIAIASLISLAIESSGRARAQEEVIRSQQLFKSVAAATNDTIWDWNLETDTYWWYDGFDNLYGGVIADAEAGIRTWIRRLHPEDRERVVSGIFSAIENGDTHWTDEYRFLNSNEAVSFVRDRGQILRDSSGKATRMVGGMTDLTDQKTAESELKRSHHALRMLSSCNEMLVRATSENELLVEACRLAVEIGGYHMAWVGYAMDDGPRTVMPMAHAGDGHGYVSEISISWDEKSPFGQGPAGRVIRSGEGLVIENLIEEPTFLPWVGHARKHGFRSFVGLPLRTKNRVFGVICLYATEVRPTGADEMKMLREMANDLAFGIENIRSRDERQRTQEVVIKVAQAVSSGVGSEFFDLLTRNMVESMDALGGLIGRFDPVRNAIDTTSFFFAGQSAENISYGLAETPCANVIAGDICVFESGVSQLFPADHLLLEFGIEGYAGIPLFQRDGKVTGIMVLLFAGPMKDISLVKSTLQIFAARAASELDRQQAEARIREQASLLDKSRDAIFVRGLDHRITYWNKSAERLYGWSAEQAIGQLVHQILYQDADDFYKAHEQTLALGEWTGEIKKIDKSGREILVEGRWTLVSDDLGQPKSVFVLNTDITEQRKLEQQFLRAQRVESIGTLAGGIAHDLNNILAPISMAVELLRMQMDGARSLELLDTISSSAKRGADMVGQVLSFARGMEGRQVEVHPLQIIREIEGIMRDTFLRKSELIVNVSRDLWLIHGDPTQLHQVILNLCVNARDAISEEGKIVITAENVEIDEAFAAMNPDAAAGKYVSIEVKDFGIGIPIEVMDRIFDPFFTTKSVGKGSGLGLSTSLTIIKSHGGFIRAESRPGEGSRFKIYLPARPEAVGSTPPSETPGLPRGRGETVLVVDDEPSIREVTRQTLETYGYRVLLAADGDEAISLYTTRRLEIEVVITDMMMPGMDGQATIQRLMEINPSVKVIATSGVHANQELVESNGRRPHRFLEKPYATDELLKCLKEITENMAAAD